MHAPDWIMAAGRLENPSGTRAMPDWIAELGPGAAQSPGGFREASPFSGASIEPATDKDTLATETVTAQEEAFMRGFAEGHAKAKSEADSSLIAEQARYRELRLSFRALDTAATDALAQDLNATVLALCEQVLGEYALDTKALAQRCAAAAKRLGAGPRDLTLHLNPDTRARIDADAFEGWSIQDDPTLAEGALRLSGADGSVREGPEDWMRTFSEALGV